MIVCPNCGKQNADESVHCGFCGNQLQEGGKKTMFGMAALDPEELRKAAEAAKSAAPHAQRSNLSDASATPALPPQEDAFAKTEALPSVSAFAAADLHTAPGGLGGVAPEPSFPVEPRVDPTPSHLSSLGDGGFGSGGFGGPEVPSQPHLNAPPAEAPQHITPRPQQGFDQFGAGSNAMSHAPQSQLGPKKDNKMIIIAAVAAVVLLMMCVVVGIIIKVVF